MHGTKNIISKWILLLSITNVSGITVFKFNDLKKEEIIANGLSGLKEIRAHNNNYTDKGINTVVKKESKAKNSRKSQDFNGFKYRKLVKRIVPHDYEVKDFEYDHKFNTLFKPLVRIHKNKYELEDSSDGEDRLELIYVIDDKQFEDAADLTKDDLLLKPFSTDSVELIYVPNEEDEAITSESLINNAVKFTDSYYRPIQSRIKLVDKRKSNEDELLQYDTENVSNDESINSLITYRNQPIKADIDKRLDQIVYIPNQYENVKQNSILQQKEELLKQLQLQQQAKLRSEQMEIANLMKFNKNKNYVANVERAKELLGKQKKSTPNDVSKHVKQSLLFGPVGAITSKHYNKDVIVKKIRKPLVHKQELRHVQPIITPNDLPGSLKAIIQSVRNNDVIDTDRLLSGETANKYIKAVFAPVGHINSKHIRLQERKREIDSKTDILKSFGHEKSKQDKIDTNDGDAISKLTLLKEIAKFKANNIEQDKNNIKKEHIGPDELRTLTHIKSGEEEEVIQMIKKTLETDDESTPEPVHWRPNYPFWNYWTYDRQIEVDDCKGQLIQHGRICVGPWSKK